MGFHMLAYGAAALDATAGDVQLAAISDHQYSRANNNFQIPVPHKLLFAYVSGLTLTRARFTTASLRQRGFPQIYPLNAVLLPPSNGNIADFRDYPVTLKQEEDLRVDVTNTAANTATAFLGVTPDNINYNINNRDMRILRFTSSVTAILNGWSSPGTVTFQDTLEGGMYGIFGMGIQGANVHAGRLILQGQYMRPGAIGQAAVSDAPREIFMGKLGLWGIFNTYSPPQIETYESAAGASTPTGWLLCSKLN